MGSKRFPLFVDLTGRRVVVVGGGTVGLRRAEVLRGFGAEVTVVSPALARPVKGVRYVARGYVAGDLSDAFLAVAAADDPAVNDAVSREAGRLGIFFNRADNSGGCDFFFPAICEGDGIVAGVAGDGTDHKRTARVAREIRKILESEDGGVT